MRGSLPFAICCINLSVMIIKTIQLDHCTLSDDAVQMAKLPFWPLADSPAFLTQLFDVVAEITFNSVNLEEAVFLRFPAFLREVELAVKRVVETEVSTIEAFRLHLIDETAALRNGLPANFAVPRETDPAASRDQTEVAEGSTVSPVILEAVAQYFHLERDTSESALQSVVDKLLAGDLPRELAVLNKAAKTMKELYVGFPRGCEGRVAGTRRARSSGCWRDCSIPRNCGG